jgi:glycine dehydrogenase subunit 1
MDYVQLTDDNVAKMLATIGVNRVADLFRDIPEAHRLDRALDVPPAMSEVGLLEELGRLADANHHCGERICFLGGGAYDHFIPTVVDDLSGQSEFVTAYTPYQAEASQGSLQAFYEYQTLICQLTGMDVSNASLYESASALAEAVLMARSVNGRKRVLISAATHPDFRAVLDTYATDLPLEPVEIATVDGLTDLDDLTRAINEGVTAVVVQSPNVFGCTERLDLAAEIAHGAGALLIAAVDPISCGLLKSPGDLGADIVVGEGQPLGIPMAYGGPYLGFLACREKYVRKMPGRLVGATHDASGRRGYCLTLQTREQHIRRERATSNVCTNQGLLALRAAIYLSAMGRRGLSRVASLCLDKAHYTANRIAELDDFALAFSAGFFKEFVVRTAKDVPTVLEHCRDRNILAGIPLAPWYDALADCFLVAVTEKRSRAQIDALVDALATA